MDQGGGDAVLLNDVYKARHKVDNPNIAVLKELHDAGVELRVCGQGLMGKNLTPAQVLPGAPVGDVADAARAAIDSLSLPAGYRFKFGGDVKNLNETKGYVLQALGLAVVFIYLILASLFGSFIQPLSIMLSLEDAHERFAALETIVVDDGSRSFRSGQLSAQRVARDAERRFEVKKDRQVGFQAARGKVRDLSQLPKVQPLAIPLVGVC